MDTKVSKSRPSGFNVTTVIGRVEYGEGEESAWEAAFKLIAADSVNIEDGERTYEFPGASVTVNANLSTLAEQHG